MVNGERPMTDGSETTIAEYVGGLFLLTAFCLGFWAVAGWLVLRAVS